MEKSKNKKQKKTDAISVDLRKVFLLTNNLF